MGKQQICKKVLKSINQITYEELLDKSIDEIVKIAKENNIELQSNIIIYKSKTKISFEIISQSKNNCRLQLSKVESDKKYSIVIDYIVNKFTKKKLKLSAQFVSPVIKQSKANNKKTKIRLPIKKKE